MADPAVPVSITGVSPNSYLLAGINLILGTLLVALIKVWPNLRKLANEREAAQAALKREDMDDMRERITALETKAEAAMKVAHDTEMKLVYAINAFQLLAAKIRADNPDDQTLRQATEMMAAATQGGLPSWAGKLADGLDRIKG